MAVDQGQAGQNVEQSAPEDEEFAFSYILEALTQGLYPNVLDVIREYVQNAYDAILRHMLENTATEYKIKVNITGNSVFISDNGIGMTAEQVRQYRYVGHSEKKLGEEAGFRGIGKLSGISVADRLIVSTSTAGDGQRHTLSMDARGMLSEILALKVEGRNKPLNELIRDNTEITSAPAENADHYTIVELHNIRPEHSVLVDQSRVIDYLSRVGPAPLDPSFKFQKEIDQWLAEHVDDYVFLPLLVNDEPVCKAYTNHVDTPEFVEIDNENGSSLAFAWACANTDQEQLPEEGARGLVFRQKNIAIGGRELLRTLLWTTSGHLAYWYFGEVHVIDPEALPTAERSGFEDNEARQRLVSRCQDLLIKKLVKAARSRSGRANAVKKLEQLQSLVQSTEIALGERKVSKETAIYAAAKLINAEEKATKVQSKLPAQQRAVAAEVREQSGALVKRLQEPEAGQREAGAFDIREHLVLSENEWKLYDLVVETLKDALADEQDMYVRIVQQLQERMLRRYRER